MIDLLAKFQDPRTIFYWPYVLVSLGISLGWLVARDGRGLRDAAQVLGTKKVWLSRSTAVDTICSRLHVLWLRGWVAACESACFYAIYASLGDWLQVVIPEQWLVASTTSVEALLATLVTMVAIDFSSYVVHRAMHSLPLLWRIHAFHHSATQLTLFTTYRQHPLEPFLLNCARASASAVGLALFHSIFTNATPVITIYGMGAGFFVYMLTTNLHHSHIPVSYPRWLRAVLISPHHHQIHHSIDARHHNRNFGVVFSIWDRLGGTYWHETLRPGYLTFGVEAENSGWHGKNVSHLESLISRSQGGCTQQEAGA